MCVYQELSDNELISLFKVGDQTAYAEIYNRYFQLLFVFCYKKLRDEEIAKDLVQELFVKLWEQKERAVVVSNFSAYLFVMMRNRILNHFKHQQVGERYNDFLTNYATDLESGQPDFRIREKQLADYIDIQIQALPRKMRQIFEMSRKEFFSHKQIALQLGTSENNVKTQIVNALRILRSKVGKVLQLLLFC